MSADNLDRNVVEFTRPVLLTETPVYDLAATRQRRVEQQESLAAEPTCQDGVCVLAWRPRKPCGDAA